MADFTDLGGRDVGEALTGLWGRRWGNTEKPVKILPRWLRPFWKALSPSVRGGGRRSLRRAVLKSSCGGLWKLMKHTSFRLQSFDSSGNLQKGQPVDPLAISTQVTPCRKPQRRRFSSQCEGTTDNRLYSFLEIKAWENPFYKLSLSCRQSRPHSYYYWQNKLTWSHFLSSFVFRRAITSRPGFHHDIQLSPGLSPFVSFSSLLRASQGRCVNTL